METVVTLGQRHPTVKVYTVKKKMLCRDFERLLLLLS